MADVEELRGFVLSIKSLFDYSARSYRNKDSVGAEHCKSKLENYAAIVVAMAVAVSENEELGTTNSAQHSASVVPNHNSLSNTLSDLLRALETWVLKSYLKSWKHLHQAL